MVAASGQSRRNDRRRGVQEDKKRSYAALAKTLSVPRTQSRKRHHGGVALLRKLAQLAFQQTDPSVALLVGQGHPRSHLGLGTCRVEIVRVQEPIAVVASK